MNCICELYFKTKKKIICYLAEKLPRHEQLTNSALEAMNAEGKEKLWGYPSPYKFETRTNTSKAREQKGTKN